MTATNGAAGAADVVCVVGMGRSGTSMTTRLLALLGVYLGPEDELLPPAPGSNPTGFWEHGPLTALGEEILVALGGAWNRPPALAGDWLDDPCLVPLRERAGTLFEARFAGHPLWGWKDPRTSLLLPFWQELLPRMRYVVCIREPADVAASLAARDSLSAERSYGLWLRYTQAALDHTEGSPRIVVAYEDTIADPVRQLERLARFLRGKPGVDAGAAAAARAFVDPGLQHHRTVAAPTVPPAVRALHDALAADSLAPVGGGRLQSFRRRLRARSER